MKKYAEKGRKMKEEEVNFLCAVKRNSWRIAPHTNRALT